MRIDEVEDLLTITKRMQRKIEVLRLDFKAKNMSAKYDMDELLTLSEMAVKKMNAELNRRNKDG